MDIVKTCLYRIDTTKIYPKFLDKILTMLTQCSAKGYIYVATSGYRSYAEQDVLYAQGRTAPGHICTEARAGQSNHNFGVSIDFARDMKPMTPGLQPSWDLKDLQPMINIAVSLGLESGAHWVSISDDPHIQLMIKKYGIKFRDLDAIYRKNNNLQDVWDFLDKYDWS